MFVATLVADGQIDDSLLAEFVYQFDTDCTAGQTVGYEIIDDGKAADIFFKPAADFHRAECGSLAGGLAERFQAIAQGGYNNSVSFDVFVQRVATRDKSLLIADMDSTMITVECIDELADYAGIKPQIAAITERAMRGELDFRAALTERVALLAGMKESVIAECLAERVRLTSGARTLVRTMTAHGARAVLVSGGFTRFAEPVAAMAGFDVAIANVLEIDGGVLTGRVLDPIIDSQTKLATLNAECAALGINPSAVLAVGDGANDIPMLEAAGLGAAYRGHPKAVEAADCAIRHGDLTALLYAQGYRRRDWCLD